ncbi:MAG: hypothetical protein ACYCZO_08670 [Daejeonella sp.]
MPKQLPKLFLDVEDVMKFHSKSRNWAYDRLNLIIIRYKLEAHQRVTIFQFCEYEGIPEEKFLKAMRAPD